ncbi:MAG: D-lyxose/D-mannose family sugar isomerase [Anaerolineales bacterium]|nr:D-lyxose/D-mannose family sugar isomerase [Anaerolineales bacterium]
MKRSEINRILRDAEAFIREHGFHLPPFAYWTPDDWQRQAPEAREIVERRLGWDVTDFGSGDYARCGLFLFTLRNGDLARLSTGRGKLYAEKLLVVDVDQVTPPHFHFTKTEDIINRGGDRLVIQVYNSTPDEGLADTPVTVQVDGQARTVPAGGALSLLPGESITVPDHLYHAFCGADARVLVGEVSLVNDDFTDNRFYEPLGRFPAIVEDEPPLYHLVGDYSAWARSTD